MLVVRFGSVGKHSLNFISHFDVRCLFQMTEALHSSDPRTDAALDVAAIAAGGEQSASQSPADARCRQRNDKDDRDIPFRNGC